MSGLRNRFVFSSGGILFLAISIGLLARTWVIGNAPGHSFAVDELFDTLAWNLVILHRFTLDGVHAAAHVGPLYPTALAVFYALVGHRPEWVPMLHVVFDLGTAWCTYRVGRALWSPWIGAWAAALMFLYPAYWTYDPRIRSEALLTLLISIWLWTTVTSAQTPSTYRYACMGFVAGLTILCKPVVLVVALFLVGLIWVDPVRRSRRGAYVIVYGATCLTLVLPWSIRNYVEFQHIIPVSAGMGAGLWMGSDPVSRGSWPMPPDQELAIWDSAGITPLPYAHAMYDIRADQLLREKGLTRISEDPVGYVGLTFTRVWDFWIGNSFYLVNEEGGWAKGLREDAADRGWTVAAYSVLKRWLFIPGLLVIAAYSGWIHRERWRDLLPLYLFPVGLTAGYVPFTVEAGRYALPVLPCLMVLSVAALLHDRPLQSCVQKRQASAPITSV